MMRILLEVQSQTPATQKISLTPGSSIRIGRTSAADISFAEDQHMSGVHFRLECNDSGCILHDLNSRNGTMVNGRRVQSSSLNHGDIVVAGETTFFVTVIKEEALAPAPTAASVDATPENRLITLFRRDFQPLYAILDCAREPSVLKVLVESGAQRQSLFEGMAGAQLAHFAPYLACLGQDSPLIEPLVRQGWGKSWGIFATSDLSFEEVRSHLQQLLTVKVEGGGQAYFRFYDPRVLRLFLPTCQPDEVNSLFGPVKYYLMEDEKPGVLLRFFNAGRGTGRETLPFKPQVLNLKGELGEA